MKKTQRLLRMILTKIDADLFYSITIHVNEITLQGKYNSKEAAKYINAGFESSINSNGFTYLTKGCLRIVLS